MGLLHHRAFAEEKNKEIPMVLVIGLPTMGWNSSEKRRLRLCKKKDNGGLLEVLLGDQTYWCITDQHREIKQQKYADMRSWKINGHFSRDI